jgi:hypothetical protein
MPGLIFKDNLSFKDGRLAITEQVDMDGVMVSHVKEMLTRSDTKVFFTQGINDFLQDPDAPADRAWESLFRVIPSTSYGELFPFRAPSVAGTGSHGIVFKQVGEGGEIEFSKTSATHKFVPNVKYGTAFAYSNEWFEDGQMNLVEMVTEDFRQAALDKLAAIHYSAIPAAVAAGIAVTTAASGTTVNHFLNDLNADATIMRRNRRRPDTLMYAPEHEQFIRTALGVRVGANLATTQAGGISMPSVELVEATRRLNHIVTEHLSPGTVYLIESKRRLFSTRRQDLRIGRFEDLLHGSETIVGTFRRGVMVAEGQTIRARSGVPQTLAVA